MEEWAEIPGFPNYQVSNQGRVYNKNADRFLSPGYSSENILRVTLYADGVAHVKYVHLLVQQAFHPSYRGRMTWADRNRQNNRAENIIPREVLPQDTRPRRDGWGKRVQIIETGEVFRTVGDCARYIGGDFSKIYACLRGQRNHHLGFTFRYYEETT
jgi:hypothetical protein